MMKYIKFAIVLWLGSTFSIIEQETGVQFFYMLMGICSLALTATLICEDWIDAFEIWVAKLCGYKADDTKERIAEAITILENTYGCDCGDDENIEKAVDILNGGAY